MKTKRFVSTLLALLLVCSLPVSAFADNWYLENGDITVNATESGQTVTQGAQVDVPDSAPVITQSNSEMPTTNTVTINADAGATANVTLSGVNIDVSGTGDVMAMQAGKAAVEITGNGDVTLELDGTNTVQSGVWRAGVEKNTIEATETEAASGKGNLTITDENGTAGSLNATGNAAGIGGSYEGSASNITITGSAKVIAQGGSGGAGIGDGSDITISGSAVVTAQGGEWGAGIGGGSKGSGSGITISGSAEVTATGGENASGIGGGFKGTGSDITVSEDAQVKAQGGVLDVRGDNFDGAGAAIGDGGAWNKDGDEVEPNTGALTPNGRIE